MVVIIHSIYFSNILALSTIVLNLQNVNKQIQNDNVGSLL